MKPYSMQNNAVVYCTDNQLDFVNISVCSLLEHNPNYKIYLFTTNKEYKSTDVLNVIYINKQDLPFLKTVNIKENEHKGYMCNLPDSAYYRLLIPKYLDIDKCLYLDTDTIINRNLDYLFNININNYYVLGKKYRDLQFNSGAIVLNLDLWRKDNIAKKISDLILSNYNNNLRINDLYVINQIVKDRYINLETLQAIAYELMLTDDVSNFYILHYCNGFRPWKIKTSLLNLHLWWKYYNICKNKKTDYQ